MSKENTWGASYHDGQKYVATEHTDIKAAIDYAETLSQGIVESGEECEVTLTELATGFTLTTEQYDPDYAMKLYT